MQDAVPFLLLVGFFVVMWLLFIRPQQRRQRELGYLRGSLEVGDEVVLTSGLYGVLTQIDEQTVQLEVAEGVVLTVAKAAIGQHAPSEDPDEYDHDEPDDEYDDEYDDPHEQDPAPADQTRDDVVPKES